MPNGTSSTGQNLGSCQSNPHSSAAEDQEVYNQRLFSATQPNEANFIDRLVSGASFDHKAAMATELANFTTRMSNSSTNNGQ
ncbi:hypothetical protein M434DRAFT_32055 [Hypoxylon sp. CO27-5]|nr:hypothetical protein M434DRAFT_32055 [Hypoxylon sp. CO27-5]